MSRFFKKQQEQEAVPEVEQEQEEQEQVSEEEYDKIVNEIAGISDKKLSPAVQAQKKVQEIKEPEEKPETRMRQQEPNNGHVTKINMQQVLEIQKNYDTIQKMKVIREFINVVLGDNQ